MEATATAEYRDRKLQAEKRLVGSSEGSLSRFGLQEAGCGPNEEWFPYEMSSKPSQKEALVLSKATPTRALEHKTSRRDSVNERTSGSIPSDAKDREKRKKKSKKSHRSKPRVPKSEQYLEATEELAFDDDLYMSQALVEELPQQKLKQSHRFPTREAYLAHIEERIDDVAPNDMVQRLPLPTTSFDQSCHDSLDDRKPPAKPRDVNAPSRDVGSVGSDGIDQNKILQYLKEKGQDDQMAAATARAFAVFLQGQYDHMHQIESHTSSQPSSQHDFSDDESFDEYLVKDDGTVIKEGVKNLVLEFDPHADDASHSFGHMVGQDTETGRFLARGNSKRALTTAELQMILESQQASAGASGTRSSATLMQATNRASGYVHYNEDGVARSLEEQLGSLSLAQRACVNALKTRWEQRDGGKNAFPDSWYLRFARCSPGKPFTYKSAFGVMKRFRRRYLQLSVLQLEKQLLTKTLFPVPGLKSREGHDMFYMRPSRYFPRQTSTETIIDNLVYTMECLLESEKNSTNGIGFVANMTDWRMSNFSVSYCHKYMMTLQGRRTPTRVQLFLIVNPPSWFGSIWAIMKPMLSEQFRKKVHMIPFNEMPKYLMSNCEEYLPDDVGGMKDTDKLLKDFIVERKAIESNKPPVC